MVRLYLLTASSLLLRIALARKLLSPVNLMDYPRSQPTVIISNLDQTHSFFSHLFVRRVRLPLLSSLSATIPTKVKPAFP